MIWKYIYYFKTWCFLLVVYCEHLFFFLHVPPFTIQTRQRAWAEVCVAWAHTASSFRTVSVRTRPAVSARWPSPTPHRSLHRSQSSSQDSKLAKPQVLDPILKGYPCTLPDTRGEGGGVLIRLVPKAPVSLFYCQQHHCYWLHRITIGYTLVN